MIHSVRISIVMLIIYVIAVEIWVVDHITLAWSASQR